jgi:hypothetical protein
VVGTEGARLCILSNIYFIIGIKIIWWAKVEKVESKAVNCKYSLRSGFTGECEALDYLIKLILVEKIKGTNSTQKKYFINNW